MRPDALDMTLFNPLVFDRDTPRRMVELVAVGAPDGSIVLDIANAGARAENLADGLIRIRMPPVQ